MSMFFHFGFGSRTLAENGIYGVFGWFKNSRFQSLNSFLLLYHNLGRGGIAFIVKCFLI